MSGEYCLFVKCKCVRRIGACVGYGGGLLEERRKESEEKERRERGKG